MPNNRGLAIGAYLVAASLILVPLLDATLAVYPLRPEDFRWRFGAAGLLSNAVITPNAGVLLILVTAISLGHVALRRTIGALASVAAVFWAGAMVLFVLDALQMKPLARPEMRTSFNVASYLAFAKMTLDLLVLAALGVVGLRGARAESAADARAMMVTDSRKIRTST